MRLIGLALAFGLSLLLSASCLGTIDSPSASGSDTGHGGGYDRSLPMPCWATFEHGWYDREVSVDSWWVWSSGGGSIVVNTDRAGTWLLEAQVASSVLPNDVTLVLNGRQVGLRVVDWTGFRALRPAEIPLVAGLNILQVTSSAPPRLIGADTRPLAVAVRNFTLTRQSDWEVDIRWRSPDGRRQRDRAAGGSITCEVAQ